MITYSVCVRLVCQIIPVAPQWAEAVRRICPDAYDYVVMFLDGTLRRTCQPCPNPRKLPPGITPYQCQRAQYSGHKHSHGFKFHALVSPSGIVPHLFGPIDGRRHDSFMLTESGLLPLLSGLTHNGIDYLVYADSAYPVTRNLIVPIARVAAPPGSVAARLNEIMAVARTVTSEWLYGIVTNTFQTLDFARWQRQWWTAPALQYFAAVFLTNCRTCLDGGNKISKFFYCYPPDLGDYLSGQF